MSGYTSTIGFFVEENVAFVNRAVVNDERVNDAILNGARQHPSEIERGRCGTRYLHFLHLASISISDHNASRPDHSTAEHALIGSYGELIVRPWILHSDVDRSLRSGYFFIVELSFALHRTVANSFAPENSVAGQRAGKVGFFSFAK